MSIAATIAEAEPLADAVELTLTVPNKLGLHARPAAKLVAIRIDIRPKRPSPKGQNASTPRASIKSPCLRQNKASLSSFVRLVMAQSDVAEIQAAETQFR